MEPLDLVLGAKLTDFLGGLARGVKGIDAFANGVGRAKQTITRDLGAIERSLKAMPAALGALAAAGGLIRQFSNETKSAAGEASDALRDLGAAALDTTRAVEDGFGAAADAADRAGGRIGAAAGRARGAAGGLEDAGAQAKSGLAKAFGAIENGVNGAGSRIKSVLTDVRTALAALGGAALGKEIIDSTAEFQDALGQLAIVADDTGVPIEEFRQKLLALAETTPQDLIGLTNALGTAIGSLPKGANQAAQGFAALDAAQKAARASGATTEQVLQGITSVLNTYGKTGITAAQVSDKLFATFDQGAATVPEIASSIGQVAGIASTFGISIDELLGSVAVLTRVGQSASEAITNVRQALISIARPPEVVKKQLDALNEAAGGTQVEFGAAALRTKGLIGVLEDLQKAGGATNLEKLLPDTQGFLAASTLLSAGLDQVRDDIARVGDSTGKTDAAVAKIAKNFSQTAGIAKNQLQETLIAIGERVLPKVQSVIERIGNFLSENRDEIAAGFEKLFNVISGIGEFILANGPQILLFFGGFKIGGLLNDAAEAAKDFGDQLNGLAQSAGDAADQAGELGEDLADEFGESFGGKIAGKIGKALKVASVATEVIAAAVAIGNVIGNYIGEAIANAIYGDEQRKSKAAAALTDEILEGVAKERGFENFAAMQAAQKSVDTGAAVTLGGEVTGGQVVPVGEALAKGRGDRVQAALDDVDARIGQLKIEAQQFEQERKLAEEERRRAEAEVARNPDQEGLFLAGGIPRIPTAGELTGQAAPPVFLDQRIAAADAKLKRAEENLKSVNRGITAAEDRRKAIEQGIATAEEAAGKAETEPPKLKSKADRAASKKAAEDAARAAQKAAEDAAKAQNELDAARAQADEKALAALEKKTDAAIKATEREAAASSDYAVRIGDSQQSIAKVWTDATARIGALVEQQVQLAQKAGDAEIQAARVAADEKIRQYEGSAEAQKVVAQQLAETEVRIQQATADRVAEIQQQQAERLIELDQRRLAAVLAASRAQVAKQAKADPTQTAVGDQLAYANRVGSNPAGTVGALIGTAAGGQAGAVAGAEIAAQIATLPQTLKAASEFLRTGLADFVEVLAMGAGDFLLALVEGLPEQIDRLINVVGPRIIVRLIAAIPRFTQAVILFAPKIVAALLSSLISGLQDALTAGVGKAFAAAGAALIGGIQTAFAKIVEYIKAALQQAADFATGGFLDKIPVIGTATKAARKVVGYAYSNTIGRLFHSGGMIRGGSDPTASAQMALAGAPHFAFGGMVPRIGTGAQRAIQRALSGDDVPAILQAGEGVLSRAGMAALGGDAALAALNRGQSPGGLGGVQVQIIARDGADRFLAQHAIGSVTASLVSPTGGVRQALDRTTRAAGAPPLMQRYVARAR